MSQHGLYEDSASNAERKREREQRQAVARRRDAHQDMRQRRSIGGVS